MSDDPNIFDDDSLTPDWMREMGMGGDAPAGDDASPDDVVPQPASRPESGPGAAPPWQRAPGADPPPPAGLSPVAPPWEMHPGTESPPPAPRASAAPWDQASVPASGEDAGWDLEPSGAAFDGAAWDAADESAAQTVEPGGEIPSGMTGYLPWREGDAQQPETPAEPPADEGAWTSFDALFDDDEPVDEEPEAASFELPDAGLPDEPLTMADMADEFADVAPQEEAPPPPQPSLRDRLLSLSPERGEEPERPPDEEPAEPLRAEEAEWLDAFGTAAEYDAAETGMAADDDDLAWLDAGEPTGEPDEIPLDVEISDLSGDFDADAVFDDQFADELPGEAPVEEETVEDVFDEILEEAPEEVLEEALDETLAAVADVSDDDAGWLMDDLGDVPALRAQPEPEPDLEPQRELPDWVRAAYAAEDEAEAEPEEDVAAPQDEAVPDWLDVTLEDEPEPEPPKKRPSGIRRIGQSAEEDVVPDDDGEFPAWVHGAADAGEEGVDFDSRTPPEGMTFDEWERVQAERAREAQKSAEDRLMEAVPDWFKKIDGAPQQPTPEAPGEPPKRSSEPEFVPGWFLGLEDQDDQETPDWLKDMDYSADALAQPLSASQTPEPPPEEGGAEPEVPDWFKGTETPEVPGVDWDALFGASQAGEPQADMPAGEEPEAEARIAPLAEDFTAEFAGDSMDKWPDEPDDASSEVPDEASSRMLDEGAEIAPGEMPDWLAEAAPSGTPDELAPDEDELPLPDLDALMGEVDLTGAGDEVAPGEVPDWLAEAAPEPVSEEVLDDVRAAPEDIPFPELDLDQTMPTEAMFEAELDAVPEADLFGAGEPEEAGEPPEDFVERFEPLAPEQFDEMPAPVDDDAPDWLREMASAEGEELPDDLYGIEATTEPTYGADLDAMPGEELDWLDAISPGDVAPSAEEEAEPAGESITDRAFPDAALFTEELDEEGDYLETASLDSGALDQLLGLYEPAEPELPEPEEPVEEFEALAEEAEIEPAEEAGVFYEITGVPDPDRASGEAMPDLDALFAEEEAGPGDEVPDLDALFDQADQGMDTLFPEGEADLFAADEGEEFAAGGEGVFTEEDEVSRPVHEMPESRPVFRRPAEDLERRDEPAEPEAPEPLTPSEPQPEWVDELRPSDVPVTIKAGGAEISLKQRQVTELPDRLRAFREEAMRDLKAPSEPLAPSESGPLAGISGALPLVDVDVAAESARHVEGLTITREQQARVNKLQAMLALVAAEEEEVEADRVVETADDFAYAGALIEEGAEAAPAVRRRVRRRSRFKPDRLLVAVLLLVALIVPFVTDVAHFADDPPPLAGDQQPVADVIDTLAPGDYVLVALEYGPTSAGELDALAQAVLRDVLAENAVPLTTSTVPAGVFHAEAMIAPLVDDAALLVARGGEEAALESGVDYVTLSFLPGDAIGVRALRNVGDDVSGLKLLPTFKFDVRGDETDLLITDLAQDVALIVVVGDESGAVRTWAEQLEGVDVPKIALVTEAVEPLVVPYVNEDGYAGYLAGVRDTYSYNAARNADRAPYDMPDDLPVDLPDPEEARWHSMALGAAGAAGLIALGVVVNLFRSLARRRRR